MRRNSVFWKIYGCVTAVCVIVCLVLLAVFYDFLNAYEASVPDTAAQKFAESLEKDDILFYLDAYLGAQISPYENPQSILAICDENLNDSVEITAKRDYLSGNTGSFMCELYSGTELVGNLRMKQAGTGKYGLPAWEIQEVIITPAVCGMYQEKYTICVPAGATLHVNGKAVDDECLVDSDAEDAGVSVYETHIARGADRYVIDNLYSVPDFTCFEDGQECVLYATNENNFRFVPGDFIIRDYILAVPAGSDVIVNGIPLRDTDRIQAGIPYKSSSIEENCVDLPEEERYLLQSLREFPQIRAELGGTELVITVEEDLITAEYPVSLLHSYEICVPSGAEVLVRGVSLDSFPHASHNGSYEPLLADNTDVKLYTTYALNELFLPLKDSDIVVMLQGVKLSAPTGPGVNDADFNFSYPTAGNSNITDACMEYLFAYFTYVSSGYKNIDSNLECVLSYVNPSSGLYNKLKKSKESISFVTPITREVRNEITVRETIPVSEDVYICTLYFNIDHWTYQYQKNYSGTVKLLCKSTVDGVCILDMLME